MRMLFLHPKAYGGEQGQLVISPENEVIATVRARRFTPADDNEADAVDLLLWAIETRGGVR